MSESQDSVRLRSALQPGDPVWIAERHGSLYAAEHGFEAASFAAYVADPLNEVLARAQPRDRVWIAEQDGRRVGCVAMVERAPAEGQLRWFLVEPNARRRGTGTLLIEAALAFALEQGYERVVLWTVGRLEDAARLYRRAGFRLTVTRSALLWGCVVQEERYDLDLP